MDIADSLQSTDLKLITRAAHILWPEVDAAEQHSTETWLITTMAHRNRSFSRDQWLRAYFKALAHRAERQSQSIGLSINERLILVFLHEARWKYSEVAAFLGLTEEDVEKRAWQARLAVMAEKCSQEGLKHWAYPVGSQHQTPSCPEYDPQRPWTQRFLDQAYQTRTEELFLTSHLKHCPSCLRTLNLARKIYYDVDKWIHQLGSSSQTLKQLTDLQANYELWIPTSQQRTGTLLKRFFTRPDVVLSLVFLGAIIMSYIRWHV